MEKVSVIIPTFNRAKTIEKAVRSVLDQTYKNVELIIVHDASSDDTGYVIDNLKDDRIKYIKLPKNKGAAGARNEGVKFANTKYIAFHDSDDIWLPEKIEKQLKYADMHPEYDLIYGKMMIYSQEGNYEYPNETVPGDLEGYIYPWLLIRNTIGAPTMLIKKDAYEKSGGFNESLRCLEDWEFALRFSQEHKIGFLNEILMNYYTSENGVSHNKAAYYETRCMIVALHKNNIDKLGIFDKIVMDIFSRAEKSGVLPQVQKILMTYLSEGR